MENMTFDEKYPSVQVGTANSTDIMSLLEELECICGSIKEINPGYPDEVIKKFYVHDLEEILEACIDLEELCVRFLKKAQEE